ncbi:TIGR00269 family protein [Thermospira aquatica]|uniref:TIGR00269 family protein n=1 Tax=Thermospira aquatica TaxID=2828656 RepID=A0AAX3BE07_9SPIR|nr:TIGR00269 family protein [Thermospira aquatica]URA09961.1 TIGR00269 family protein [Thermospira aquatica]
MTPPKCTICKAKKTYFPVQVVLPSYNLKLCREHFLEWLEGRVAHTIKKYRMFTCEDKILVAVSGGKDSLGLWFLLHRLGYEADGLYIDLGIPEYSAESREHAQTLANRLGRTLHVVDMREELAPIGEMRNWTRKPPCSVCGTVKRYYMNRIAREKGYTVLATGHNLDDETAVLWNNTLHWNMEYLAKQYPVLAAQGPFLKKVKPLCLVSEKESALYTIFNRISYVKPECPYSTHASSLENKRFLQQLEEARPGTKITFYTGFLKNLSPLLHEPLKSTGVSLALCKVCGEPTTTEICFLCQLKQKMGKI